MYVFYNNYTDEENKKLKYSLLIEISIKIVLFLKLNIIILVGRLMFIFSQSYEICAIPQMLF